MTPNIRLTGPTPLAPSVQEAASGQMISHRSQNFRNILRDVVTRLKPLFGTAEPPMPFTTSGTGGLEAAVVNTLEPGQRVLAVKVGYFGDRFAEIAQTFGCRVVEWALPWGEGAEPSDLRKKIRESAPLDAVLLTHNETSTGVLNPLEGLAEVIRAESDALILVDGVSSVGAVPIEMDRWGIDVLVTASQKALMAPPGLALVAAGKRAMTNAQKNRIPRYFFDFSRMRAAVDEGTTTYTPALSSIFGLQAALALIEKEGLPAVYSRHQRLSKACRDGLSGLGLQPFAKKGFESPSVTSMLVPTGFSASAVRQRLQDQHATFIAQGRAQWKDSLLRFGHMGWVSQKEIQDLIDAVKAVLSC